MPLRFSFSATALTLALILSGCGSTPVASTASPESHAGGTKYPLTVENCGEEVIFDQAPQRVILLESASVTILEGLGVLDRVVTRAGSFPGGYYDSDLTARLDDIEMLSEDIDTSGHLVISAEVVLAQAPDLVLGLPEGLTREGLHDGGANTLIQPVFCPNGVENPSFESLYDQIRMYGRIFDRYDQAEQLVSSLAQRVAEVKIATADAPKRTAAVLYPSVGGGPLYAYGRASMSQPQLEAAGLTNVFGDSSERVFEVNIEELINRNPEVLIVLHQGNQTGALEEIKNHPGAGALHALRDGEVLLQLFNFTEPPTPLSVDGLERIVDRFATGS
ncbi:ABC transporter substrate-binding protein [Microbacterium sp.]|uniref:ABC transporter substrate-binding protein n=1 Tax=Microbacterium sp. TaxID=51671 RepID=UPI003A8FB76C